VTATKSDVHEKGTMQ